MDSDRLGQAHGDVHVPKFHRHEGQPRGEVEPRHHARPARGHAPRQNPHALWGQADGIRQQLAAVHAGGDVLRVCARQAPAEVGQLDAVGGECGPRVPGQGANSDLRGRVDPAQGPHAVPDGDEGGPAVGQDAAVGTGLLGLDPAVGGRQAPEAAAALGRRVAVDPDVGGPGAPGRGALGRGDQAAEQAHLAVAAKRRGVPVNEEAAADGAAEEAQRPNRTGQPWSWNPRCRRCRLGHQAEVQHRP
mmetsp:Transcript_25404/g.79150  ORF Transcript_25404/g.79150 Transcript_25404/m.79150 type:complete len:246 (+) Transcript_25404:218-955(+)